MQYVMWLIRYICEKVGIADSHESWRSYDRMNKKIIVCEYCGRILVSNLLDENNAEE